jgi:hypothetical protein
MMLNNLFKNKILILLLLLVIPTVSALFASGYYPMHDDMQAMRLLQMDKCINDGQIPCRWVPDMGFGYGYPQFNYYSPLPYYLMEIFVLAGVGFLDSVRIFLILATTVSVVGMYLLGSSLWGRWGGFLSAVLYGYVPYRAVNLYVRGAMGEIVAMTVAPFIFLFVYRLWQGKKYSVVGLSLSLAALLTSHNISSLIFIPLTLLFFALLAVKDGFNLNRQFYQRFARFITAIFLAIFISAFFILPALTEARYVQTDTLTSGYFNYLAHFVSLPQMLFSSYWGYGASVYEAYDQLHLGVGLVYWILPLVALAALYRTRHYQEAKIAAFFTGIGWFGLFMMHSRSTLIWQQFGVLEYFQFPWRFYLLTTFAFCLASGALVVLLKERKRLLPTVFALTALIILFSGSFFRPSEWLNIDDEEKFSDDSWQLQQTISINDYLPKTVRNNPKEKAPDEPLLVEGEVKLISGRKGTNWQKWEYEVAQNAIIELPLFYFPGWEVKVNTSPADLTYDNELGLMRVALPQGKVFVQARLKDTPVRSIGNILSIMGFAGLVFVTMKEKRK